MVLSDSAILLARKLGLIKIEPFDRKCLGSNSYDVRLGGTLRVYDLPDGGEVLDPQKVNKTTEIPLPKSGYVLQPYVGYLGYTLENTGTFWPFIPYLEGKSSLGRLFLDIHATAGKGDVGFVGHWTLEMSCVHPTKVYPGMPIGQLIYYLVLGPVLVPYHKKESAKYKNQPAEPVASLMHKNFQ